MVEKKRPGGLIVLISGLFVLILGYLVLFGWWIDNQSLVRIAAHLPNMQYNTAVSFFLSGVSLLLVARYRYLSFIVGVLIILLAALTLVQYIFSVDLGINRLLILSFMKRAEIGPMAPNSAVCFILSGIAFILMSRVFKMRYIATSVTVLGLLVLVLSVLALVGYFANLPATYGWHETGKMSFHSALGFLANAYQTGLIEEVDLRIFLPLATFMVGILFFILLWQALLTNEYNRVKQLTERESRSLIISISSVLPKSETTDQIKLKILPILQVGAMEGFSAEIRANDVLLYSPKYIDQKAQLRFGAIQKIKLNNVWFDIKIWPNNNLLSTQISYYPLLTLLVGIAFTLLMSLLMRLWQSLKRREVILENEIEQRQRAEEELQNVAYYDYLTGLSNRFLFKKSVETALARARRHERVIGICLVDVDSFHEINDGLGRDVSDEILKVLAHRLSQCIRDADVLARLSGDTFSILLDEMVTRQDADSVATRILDSLKVPISTHNHQVDVSVSIGIAAYPEGGTTVSTLIRNATLAMNRVKKKGGSNYEYYTSYKKSHNEYIYKIESGLHKALNEEQFVLHYQPIVDIHTQQIEALEVLVRWNHPDLGWISPDDFIPIAEELGLIIPIGDWILRTACKHFRVWKKQDLTNFRVAINLAVQQLMQADLAERVKDIFQETNISPQDVQFEITETSIMRYLKKANVTLNTMAKLGIEILLDDFGTGYSSLTYLHQLPISGLKIDKSFITNVIEDDSAAKIVTSIIQLARSFGIKVIAEGVESEKQYEWLKAHHCQYIQGYIISRSLTADEMMNYLKSHKN